MVIDYGLNDVRSRQEFGDGERRSLRSRQEVVIALLGKLTMHEFRALSLLLVERRRATDLARRLGASPTAVTMLVDRMERKGWVRRHHDLNDRRVVWTELTALGRQIVAPVWEAPQPAETDAA